MHKNVRLSLDQLEEIMSQPILAYMSIRSPAEHSTICGYPLKTTRDGYMLFIACEYCRRLDCKCGAPLELQGAPLVQAGKQTVYDALMLAIHEARKAGAL